MTELDKWIWGFIVILGLTCFFMTTFLIKEGIVWLYKNHKEVFISTIIVVILIRFVGEIVNVIYGRLHV